MPEARIENLPEMDFVSAESMNALCTNLTFTGDSVKTIMVTSSHASEGKSTTSINMLNTMVNLRKRAVLIDMDLRRSEIVSRYGVRFDSDHPAGITHFLSGQASLQDTLYRVNDFGSCLIPVIKTVSNPTFLLNSSRLQELFDQLESQFDYLIVDAPPIGAVIDAAQIARCCDGALVVVSYNQVRKRELMDIKAQLDQTQCPVLGAVINRAKVKHYGYYKYDYYHSTYAYANK